GYYVRDASGMPTGCLQEGAAYSFWSGVVPRASPEDWRRAIRVAQTQLHSLGITGWQDAWVEPDLLRAYRSLDDASELHARVVTALWWDRHRGWNRSTHSWIGGCGGAPATCTRRPSRSCWTAVRRPAPRRCWR